VDARRRYPRVICKHCGRSFVLPESFDVGDERRVQVQCPRKQCGEWSWYERHEIVFGRGRAA
jgi:hypothetical protein